MENKVIGYDIRLIPSELTFMDILEIKSLTGFVLFDSVKANRQGSSIPYPFMFEGEIKGIDWETLTLQERETIKKVASRMKKNEDIKKDNKGEVLQGSSGDTEDISSYISSQT